MSARVRSPRVSKGIAKLTAVDVTGAASQPDLIEDLFFKVFRGAIPDLGLTVSQWADKYRYLSQERSARPGKWSTDLVPFLRDIMDACSDPSVWKVVFIKPNQVGGTECANNLIGYCMHAKPSQILYACETEDKAKAWSTESLAPMIRDTPELNNLLRGPRVRDSGNTIKSKSFPGGQIALGWATSASTASSRPRSHVILDEFDAFKPTPEGDYGDIATLRMDTFEDKLVFIASTPRNRLENPPGTPLDAPRFSPIEREYEESDKRKYFVPCPHCKEFQVLEWDRVQWDDEPLLAYYVCVNGCVIEEEEKTDMLADGQWRASAPFRGIAGFHLNKLYSPFVTWGECADKYVKAKRSGDPEKMRVWVNTTKSEGWQDDETKVETKDLTKRREDYYGTVPNRALILTVGVDVQGNRLECEVVGWGLNNESWSIDYVVIEGDPAFDSVWSRLLTEVLSRQYIRADGLTMKVWCAAIDSGGHHSDPVFNFARENSGRRVYAIHGSTRPGQPLVSKPTIKRSPPVKLYSIGTETAKDSFAACLRVAEKGPGYCHFPIDDTKYGEDYFKQLLSERPVANKKGVRVWQKIKEGLRNEALDCRVYARAALAILNPPMISLAREWRKRIELHEKQQPAVSEPPASAGGQSQLSTPVPPASPPAPESAPSASADGSSDPTGAETSDSTPQTRKKKRRRGRNFATGWKSW
jgi:phage terminase large subunit GpA-like protein